MNFYFAQGDAQKGPVAIDQLLSQGVRGDTLVWREGMSGWQRADSVAELRHLFPPAPMAAPQPPAAAPQYAPPPQSYAAPQQPYAPPPQQYAPAPQQYPPPMQPYAQTYGQPMQMGYGQPVPPAPGNGISIASLVLGIIAIPMTCVYGLGIILAILAVIFGHVGHSQSKAQTGQANGMATAGLVCGYISLGIVVLVFIIALAAWGSVAPRW